MVRISKGHYILIAIVVSIFIFLQMFTFDTFKKPIARDPSGHYSRDFLFVYIYKYREGGCSFGLCLPDLRLVKYKILFGANPRKFKSHMNGDEFVGPSKVLASDGRNVYYGVDGKVDNGDPATLKYLGTYGWDKNNAYVDGHIFKDISDNGFKSLGPGFVLYNGKVYATVIERSPQIVPSVDIGSFKVYKPSHYITVLAEDANNYYILEDNTYESEYIDSVSREEYDSQKRKKK